MLLCVLHKNFLGTLATQFGHISRTPYLGDTFIRQKLTHSNMSGKLAITDSYMQIFHLFQRKKMSSLL